MSHEQRKVQLIYFTPCAMCSDVIVRTHAASTCVCVIIIGDNVNDSSAYVNILRKIKLLQKRRKSI